MKEFNYLVITEFGIISKVSEIDEQIIAECNDGYLTIIDMRGPSEYKDGCWVEINESNRN